MLSQYALIIRGPVTKVQFGDFFCAILSKNEFVWFASSLFMYIKCIKGGVV